MTGPPAGAVPTVRNEVRKIFMDHDTNTTYYAYYYYYILFLNSTPPLWVWKVQGGYFSR
jgi:hypothetical protein